MRATAITPTAIQRVRAYAVSPPDMPAVRYSGKEDPSTRDLEIVRLTLANGVEGVGCCDTTPGRPTPGSVVTDIRDLSERVLGSSVEDRSPLTDSQLAGAGDGPWEAISIVDCAMWDAWSRSENTPLWQLLGARHGRIEAYASTVAYLSLQEYLDDVARCVELGYRVIKLHLNTDIDFDLELVRTVADAYSDTNMRFIVDIEESYEFDEALRLGNALEGLPYDWMEAPLPDTDLDAYAELNRAVAVDVLPAGNTIVGMQHWSDGLASNAWSRLRCDVTNGGGITQVLRAMELARTKGVSVELQSFGYQPTQDANLQAMLGVGGCSYFEHAIPSEPYDYAAHNPLVVGQDGYIAAPTNSWLDMDWERIAADAFAKFDSEG